MAHNRFHEPREVVAQALRTDGPELLHKPKRLASYVRSYSNMALPQTDVLVHEVDKTLLEPLRDVAFGTQEPTIADIREARIEIAEILEEERGQSSEISLEVADALAGGYADYAGLSLADVRTPKQKKPPKPPALVEKLRGVRRRIGIPDPKPLRSSDGQKLNIPVVPLVALACVVLLLVGGGMTLVHLTQPKSAEELPSISNQGAWIVTKTTYEEKSLYDEDSSYVVVSEFTLDDHGNATSLHQEGGWNGDTSVLNDVSFEIGKDGRLQHASKTSTKHTQEYDYEYGEYKDVDEQETQDFTYLWEFDDQGHAIAASVNKTDTSGRMVHYEYNDAAEISKRTTTASAETSTSTSTYTYDSNGLPTSREEVLFEEDVTTAMAYGYSYDYDAKGLPTQCVIESSDGTRVTETYTYGPEGTISSCVVEDEENGVYRTTTYEYAFVESPSIWARQMQRIYPTIDISLYL